MKFVFALLLATRIASDFEIQQMEQQITRSKDFDSQYVGHLNLGDLRMTRNEKVQARAEFLKAYEIASKGRVEARQASDLTRYATRTLLAAAAQARLDDDAKSYELAEESMRYASDSAKNWNIYANLMALLHRYPKAVSAARNAVAIEERGGEALDLAIYRYTLASNLVALAEPVEAERLLVNVISTLRSPAFAALQKSVREHEAFETYTTVTGDESAYVSLLNRSQLRLAEVYEDRGDVARAVAQYRQVLEARSDDPDALAGLARLDSTYFIDAFNANPFNTQLIRDYQKYLSGGQPPPAVQPETTGDQMRLALQQIHRGDLTAARATLDAIATKFPNNEALNMLQRDIQSKRSAATDWRALIVAFQDNSLTPERRKQLDTASFTSTVEFNEGPPFETGTMEGIPFRFSAPTEFHGTYAAHTPLRLTFRVLGATRVGDSDGLLLEPLKVEVAR